MVRIFCNVPIAESAHWCLPPDAARHVQVLRLQPGDQAILFNGKGGQFRACITEMTRKEVFVSVDHFEPIERELKTDIQLAIGMPANERMDWLVEKATELGLTKLWPLMTHHNVVRLDAQRADKKTLHWQAVVAAACTQCGRNTCTQIESPVSFAHWIRALESAPTSGLYKWFFSLDPTAGALSEKLLELKQTQNAQPNHILIAFGPEGGWAKEEESALQASGFTALSLGRRTLRAESAAMAALATIGQMLG
jgi:16S rRNA (uracil1498-N3)-methyltransferase